MIYKYEKLYKHVANPFSNEKGEKKSKRIEKYYGFFYRLTAILRENSLIIISVNTYCCIYMIYLRKPHRKPINVHDRSLMKEKNFNKGARKTIHVYSYISSQRSQHHNFCLLAGIMISQAQLQHTETDVITQKNSLGLGFYSLSYRHASFLYFHTTLLRNASSTKYSSNWHFVDCIPSTSLP